jgi:acetyl-CoA synthetase
MLHRSDPGLFLGYHKQPDKWRAAYRGDWYDTGDVMHRDEDGYYWYHGRQDDLFKTRGMFVSPQEIEAALARHAAVAEVAVSGAPDERIGNRVCAFVVLKPQFPPSEHLTAELKESVASQLADYKVPQSIRFIEQLPKSVVGKIVRKQLPS